MYEVLLRLNDDKGTLISPGIYIPEEIDIDHAQGFYLDKPKRINEPIEEIKESIKQRSVRH